MRNEALSFWLNKKQSDTDMKHLLFALQGKKNQHQRLCVCEIKHFTNGKKGAVSFFECCFTVKTKIPKSKTLVPAIIERHRQNAQ